MCMLLSFYNISIIEYSVTAAPPNVFVVPLYCAIDNVPAAVAPALHEIVIAAVDPGEYTHWYTIGYANAFVAKTFATDPILVDPAKHDVIIVRFDVPCDAVTVNCINSLDAALMGVNEVVHI